MKWTTETVLKNYTSLDKRPSRSTVREYALKEIAYQCAVCSNTGKWWGFEMVLDLHHINGNNQDNRKENLAFMCPNCHSLTENFKGRKN